MTFANFLIFKMSRRYLATEIPSNFYNTAYEELSKLSQPWGLEGVAKVPLKDFSGQISVGVKYTKLEKTSPSKGFYFGYFNRARTAIPPDESKYDDTFTVEFYPKKVREDWRYLMDVVFPTYVAATQPYLGKLYDSEISTDDVFVTDEVTGEAWRRPDYVDPRLKVQRIWQANYWDRELCKRSFNLTPEEIVQRLSGKVANCRVFENGLLMIYSYDPIIGADILDIDAVVRPVLMS